MKNETILVVEDEPAIREMIVTTLEMAGFDCLQASEVSQAHHLVVDHRPNLILLDWMLPNGLSGIDLCRRLKKDEMLSEIPIIMLTAKGSDADRIAGLEAGADDYLPKPFNPKELLARIKAVLRRQNRELPGAPSQQLEVVEFGPWTLDLSTRTLKRDGNVVTLTTGEFSVLKALVQHPREPLTRDKLMNLARGREWGAMERSIDVQVSRLRRLIEDNPSQARYIQTVWGVGYVFVPDGAEG